MFILPKQHIITMTQVEDKHIEKFYSDTVARHINQVSSFKDSYEPYKFSRTMGNLGSIKETKKSLEDLFNKS